FILDEIQSGFGRTGHFFAHQIHQNVQPDLITIAKGMGNGFPVGGVLIAPHFEAAPGLLGTTFGGNQLACAASLGVLEIFEQENILTSAQETGDYLISKLQQISQITSIRGLGLMSAMDCGLSVAELRKNLIFEKKIYTGWAKS